MEGLVGFLSIVPWEQILIWAMPFLVMGAVHLLKKWKPFWNPYLPIIAPIAGALVPAAAAALGIWLGVPVDFSPILVVLGVAATGAVAGAASVGFHQIPTQLRKRPLPLPSVKIVQGNVRRGL